jgi:hypothetical protein
MEGSEEQGAECEMEGSEEQGAVQMDIEGNQQMDMGNDNGEHETKTDGAEVTDRHETSNSTASGSGRSSKRRSHAVMPPLVLDSEDGKTMIRPTGDG